MRSYIFTSLERKRIKAFLKGELSAGDINIRKIRSRVKTFEALSGDVDLYVRFREAVSTVSA